MAEIRDLKANVTRIQLRGVQGRRTATPIPNSRGKSRIKVVKAGSALRRFDAEKKLGKDGCGY